MNLTTNVCVYITIRNEAARIANCLETFSWADEIYVFDKSSTDGSPDIARKYATEVITIENNNEKVGDKYFKKYGWSDWVLFITASDMITPNLSREIIRLTTSEDFDKDVIGLPYKYYSFGYFTPRTTFDSVFKYILIRRCAVKMNSTVHREIEVNSKNKYTIKMNDSFDAVHHMSNATSEEYLHKMVRYLSIEKTEYGHHSTPKTGLVDIFKFIYMAFFKRKVFLAGYDGIAILAASLSYKLLNYLVVWDACRIDSGNGGRSIYNEVTNNILNAYNDDPLLSEETDIDHDVKTE